MLCAFSVIGSYQFQISLDSKRAKKLSKGDNQTEKLVCRDMVYCFPLVDDSAGVCGGRGGGDVVVGVGGNASVMWIKFSIIP